MYADPKERDLLGTTPSVSEILSILEEAAVCQEDQPSEPDWNMALHYPLLFKAIYGHMRQKQLVGFKSWYVLPFSHLLYYLSIYVAAPTLVLSTAAGIIKEYLPTNAPAKMIDFCLCLTPDDAPKKT